jgi:hypothetical protein
MVVLLKITQLEDSSYGQQWAAVEMMILLLI